MAEYVGLPGNLYRLELQDPEIVLNTFYVVAESMQAAIDIAEAEVRNNFHWTKVTCVVAELLDHQVLARPATSGSGS